MDFTKKTKVAPSSYPQVLFHGLRCAQLISSLIVGSIMFFFIHELSLQNISTPWTFIFFATASSLTVLALSTTLTLSCCVGLAPRLNLVVNSALFALWAAGFGMLSWWASETMFHACDVNNIIGNDENGRMVCRIYKALYSFAVLGFISTLLALFLDLYVFRQATRLGKYVNMEPSDVKKVDHLYPDQMMGGFNAQAFKNATTSGYAVPQEQFGYDTSYHGPGHERL